MTQTANIKPQARNFIHTDGTNLFYRQARMAPPGSSIDSMIGMSLHMILYSMKKEFTNWGGSHVVFYLEGRSWRKDIYPEYKYSRKLDFAKKTPKEQEDHALLMEAFNDFTEYLDQKTNVTVLKNSKAEADDMITVFIEAHPDDNHMLISSDSDFFQLLRFPNLTLYDPVKDIIIKQDGVYDEDGNRLEFTVNAECKIKVGKPNPNFVVEPNWYEYALFKKCIRGDKTDFIFSAYPSVREKGTKTQIGIREAFEDRGNKGYSWNNFMLQKWTDHNNVEHRVRDKYEFNKTLIDLSQIPDHVKTSCLESIAEKVSIKNVPAVEIGTGFMRFCGKWDLKRIGDSAALFMPMLKGKYQ